MSTPTDYQALLARTGPGALSQKLGIAILEASPEYTVATMPVEGNTQPVGLLHGGASAALAETLGSISANRSVADHGKAAVVVDLNTATCRAVKLGRTVCVHAIDITDEAGKLLATARITNNIIDLPSATRP